MKEYVQMMVVTAVILLLIPLVGLAAKRVVPPQGQSGGTGSETAAADGLSRDTVKMLMTETGEVVTMSEREYVIGAVLAQMPADFEHEALKAQAVLAYTYAARRRLSEEESTTAALRGADMSDDTSLYQAWFGEGQARELYGGEYEEAYERVSAAADSAAGLILCYEGEPVIAAFHGISFGRTESAFTMWGEDIPYLKSVDSADDAELDVCETVAEFTDEEITELVPELDGADISSLAPAEESENGTVLKLRAGEKLIDAQMFCERLGLPSAHFTMTRRDRSGTDTPSEWSFSVLGCGHLVGMSQYGADLMAKKGSTCEEILLHYYTNCTLVKH